jgi:hypothetical protein
LTTNTKFENLENKEAYMAGKIALGILFSFLLVGFGYALHREQERSTELPFSIKRVVDSDDHEAITIDGMNGPFTVLVYEGPTIQRTVPGALGNLGDTIWMSPPSER